MSKKRFEIFCFHLTTKSLLLLTRKFRLLNIALFASHLVNWPRLILAQINFYGADLKISDIVNTY
jgi:hypothetical protein